MTKKVYATLIFLSVLGILYLIGRNKEREIKENFLIGNGFIYEAKTGYRGGIDISYSFSGNSSTIYETTRLTLGSEFRHLFLGKSFPVVYSSENAKSNKILITEKDFKKYGLPFPDSLKWIQEKIK